MKKNSRLIVLERNKFALMVKSYRKSLHIINILTHICRTQNIDITIKLEEICHLLEMDTNYLAKQRDKGNLRFTADQNLCLFEITDIIRLKVATEMTEIYKTINDVSVIPHDRK